MKIHSLFLLLSQKIGNAVEKMLMLGDRKMAADIPVKLCLKMKSEFHASLIQINIDIFL